MSDTEGTEQSKNKEEEWTKGQLIVIGVIALIVIILAIIGVIMLIANTVKSNPEPFTIFGIKLWGSDEEPKKEEPKELEEPKVQTPPEVVPAYTTLVPFGYDYSYPLGSYGYSYPLGPYGGYRRWGWGGGRRWGWGGGRRWRR